MKEKNVKKLHGMSEGSKKFLLCVVGFWGVCMLIGGMEDGSVFVALWGFIVCMYSYVKYPVQWPVHMKPKSAHVPAMKWPEDIDWDPFEDSIKRQLGDNPWAKVSYNRALMDAGLAQKTTETVMYNDAAGIRIKEVEVGWEPYHFADTSHYAFDTNRSRE